LLPRLGKGGSPRLCATNKGTNSSMMCMFMGGGE